MFRSFPGCLRFGALTVAALGVLMAAERVGAQSRRLSVQAAVETKLLPPITDQFGFDMMGFRIAIDGNTLVTISSADIDDFNQGGIFIFQHNGTSWVHRATPQIGLDINAYVMGTAISGSTVVLHALRGLNSAGIQTGIVYLLRDTSAGLDWSSYSVITIEASDGAEGDNFGYPIALWGRTLVAGGGGDLYVFTDTSGPGDWTSFSEAKITASDGTMMDVVDVWGTGGANGETIAARRQFGEFVYVFRDVSSAHDWSATTEAKLALPEPSPSPYGRRGPSVAIDGRTIVTSDAQRNHEEFREGSVFVFQDTSVSGDWKSYSVAEVFASDTTAGAHLGWDVDVQGDTILAGAPYPSSTEPEADTGAAYVFQDTSAAGDWSSYSETRLVPPSVAVSDFFGMSVALEGSVAAVGAHYGEEAAWRDGFIDIFDGDAGWIADQRLSHRGIGDQEGQLFGERVVAEGDTVVVSAPNDDLNLMGSGSLIIYQRRGGAWVDLRQVVASTPLPGDGLGQGMFLEPGRVFVSGSGTYPDHYPDISPVPARLKVFTDTSAGGDWDSYTEITMPYGYGSYSLPSALGSSGRNAAVGDRWYEGVFEKQGIVRLFHDDSPAGDWSSVVEREITPLTPLEDANFGKSLALLNGVMLVGAPAGYGLDDSHPGAAFLLLDTSAAGDWSSFSEEMITAFDAEVTDHFGSAVVLADGWAAIGAPGDDDVWPDAGSVYILVDTGGDWSSYDMHKLVAPDPALIAEDAGFGSALAASGRYLVVGAPSSHYSGQPGSVWTFVDTSIGADWSRYTWSRLTPSDSAPGDFFGASVAITQTAVVAGAPHHTEGGLTIGAAYIFDIQVIEGVVFIDGFESGETSEWSRTVP